MRSEEEIRKLCENAINECNACNGDPEIDCIDYTQGGKAILARQILKLLYEDNKWTK